MAYLDGKYVEDKFINPENHKFIGKFRHPTLSDFISSLKSTEFAVYICGCGQHLWTREALHTHWMLGHFDEHIYETIK